MFAATAAYRRTNRQQGRHAWMLTSTVLVL